MAKEKVLTAWGEDARDCASTPEYIVDAVGRFDLDVCTTAATAKASAYYSLQDGQDALKLPWHGTLGSPSGDVLVRKVWCNPPYSNIAPWIEKALEEVKHGVVVAMLLPVRSDRKWWRLLCEHATHLDFYQGRIQFEPYEGVTFSSNREYSVLAGFGLRGGRAECYARSAETGYLL